MYNAERGRVTIDNPEHAKAINRMAGNGTAGLLNASFAVYSPPKGKGRWCVPCRRLWFAWTTECPKCGKATVAE